jgi:glycosyltransferase involved in cell wall biosynthesis
MAIRKTTIDVITSALNEEDCLPEFFDRITKVIKIEKSYTFRVIVMDNGSSDETWEIISQQSRVNPNFVGIQLSRTFTLDAAFTCGLDHANADVAILMTSDLQDPPEQISSLLRKFEEGFDQVLVRITKRGTVPVARRILSWAFYSIASRMTDGMLPKSVSDFRLMSNKTYKAINRLRESHRFMRGIGSWVGFKTGVIEMERPPRFAGESKWLGISFLKVFGQASRSIFAYSALPLMWLSAAGLLISFLTLLFLAGLIIFWLLGGAKPFAGFASLIALGSLGFSVIMLSIGILAQYLSLTYEEVKQRPLYLITKVSGKLKIH